MAREVYRPTSHRLRIFHKRCSTLITSFAQNHGVQNSTQVMQAAECNTRLLTHVPAPRFGEIKDSEPTH